ncbi:MAG: hypothetical protein Q8K26_02145 [Candidatus Gracilibacteria bacterium]|nr:hypothetical protein [Candidatus Gracilibacteria bacterium]
MFRNLRKIFSRPQCILVFFVASALIGSVFWYFSNFALTHGNLGIEYAFVELTLQILITLLFALFVAATVYKIIHFSHFSRKHSGAGVVAGFLGTLIVGCPACSISIVTYLGLTGVVGLIPGGGMTLKVASVLILIFTDIYLLRNLEVCSVRK